MVSTQFDLLCNLYNLCVHCREVYILEASVHFQYILGPQVLELSLVVQTAFLATKGKL